MRLRLLRYAVSAICLMLVICLSFSAALAEGAPSLAPMLGSFLADIDQGKPVELTLSVTLHKLSPYGEKTLLAMNRLLSECRLCWDYQKAGEAESTRMQLLIGGRAALGYAEQIQAPQTLAQTTLLPGVTLASVSDSPKSFLMGRPDPTPSWVLDFSGPYDLSPKVAGALSGLSSFAVEKKVSYKIASVGTAKNAVVYTVPEESAQLLLSGLSMLAEELPWPQAKQFLASLNLTGETVLTLYQSAEGENMGLAIKTTAAYAGGPPRKATFLWGFSVTAGKAVHTLSLKAPSSKGTDALTVSGKYTLESKGAQNSLTLSLDIKNTLDKKTDRVQWSGGLNCLLAEGNQRLEGEIVRSHTGADGERDALSIKPGLMAYLDGENVALKGSARIAASTGKNVLSDVTFSLTAWKAQAPVWEDGPQTVDLDGLRDGDRAALLAQAQDAATKSIWQAVVQLPSDCLTLVSGNISKDDWERIFQDVYRVSQ